MFLKMITHNSLIFEEIEEDDNEEKTIKISIGDSVQIQNRAGELREFYARVYDVDPYITLMIGNGTVSFRVDESVNVEYI